MSSESGRSRFSYYGDEPTEGGVQSVVSPSEVRTGKPSAPGVPGPEERLLDISELTRTVGMRYTHSFALPPAHEEGIETVTPIVGRVTLTNAGGILHLDGQASTTLKMECGRCLETVLVPVETELEEDFDLVSGFNAFHQEEIQAVDADPAAAVIKGNVFDLGDLLRQNLILAAPSQPICREDCPGIVPGAFIAATDADDPEATDEDAPDINPNNPLKNLAALLEQKRRNGG